MFQIIESQCVELADKFNSIPQKRKDILEQISAYIIQKSKENIPINLVYICTHNSRRSHFGQVWAQVAASFYKIENVHTFSGGTEETSLHPNALVALKKSGFEISIEFVGKNPTYKIKFSLEEQITGFSKKFDNPINPVDNFAAILTCSDADENCPNIPGADTRIAIPYDDPKEFDGTDAENEKYFERSMQIALECLYVFSKVNN